MNATFPKVSGNVYLTNKNMLMKVFIRFSWGEVEVLSNDDNKILHSFSLQDVVTISQDIGNPRKLELTPSRQVSIPTSFVFETTEIACIWYAAMIQCVNWRIEHHYTPIRRIGKGKYGTVVKAIRSGDPLRRVAIKMIAKRYRSMRQKREIEICEALKHQHLLGALDVMIGSRTVYMAHELMDGDLYTDMIRIGDRNENLVREIMHQILQGLVELERMKVVHRDLKLNNVLVSWRNGRRTPHAVHVRICDFGMATRTEGDNVGDLKRRCVLDCYAAKEVLEGGAHTYKADVFSAGVIMFELLFGRRPFGRCEDTVANIKNGKIMWSLVPECGIRKSKAANLIRCLLDPNMETRYDALTALDHPWFQNTKKAEEMKLCSKPENVASRMMRLMTKCQWPSDI